MLLKENNQLWNVKERKTSRGSIVKYKLREQFGEHNEVHRLFSYERNRVTVRVRFASLFSKYILKKKIYITTIHFFFHKGSKT